MVSQNYFRELGLEYAPPTFDGEALRGLLKSSVPLFILGAPGTGKSAVVKAIARERGVTLHDIRLSKTNAEDFAIPDIGNRNGGAFYDTRTNAEWKNIKSGDFVFLDEMNTASESTRNVALEIVEDRKVGNYKLPTDVVIIAAGNRGGDEGGVPMSHALNERFLFLEWSGDRQWFVKHFSESFGGDVDFAEGLFNDGANPRRLDRWLKMVKTASFMTLKENIVAAMSGNVAAAERIYQKISGGA